MHPKSNSNTTKYLLFTIASVFPLFILEYARAIFIGTFSGLLFFSYCGTIAGICCIIESWYLKISLQPTDFNKSSLLAILGAALLFSTLLWPMTFASTVPLTMVIAVGAIASAVIGIEIIFRLSFACLMLCYKPNNTNLEQNLEQNNVSALQTETTNKSHHTDEKIVISSHGNDSITGDQSGNIIKIDSFNSMHCKPPKKT